MTKRSSEGLLYSESFSQTKKEPPKEGHSRNHELLIQAGFIRQEAAGIYTMLPLGRRVLNNIEQIVRQGMVEVGGQEIMMPALQPKAAWDQSGRWDKVDVLFKLKSRIGEKEYALAATAEEIATPVAKDRIKSYRDLPLAIFQLGKKFRDEARAKSGIIRGREFMMKDMYSFHADQEDFNQFYTDTLDSYLEIFRQCGLDAKVTEASGGDFTTLPTHEFMTISDAGEDVIVYCPNCTFARNSEISSLAAGGACPNCHSELKENKAIEIGHIFDLGTRFTKDFDVTFADKNGQKQPVFMGCYGIGTSRLMGAIVETHNDERGIVWPENVAPYSCHLVGLNLDDEKVKTVAYGLYEYLIQNNISVLFDNRLNSNAGEKFKDADLIGIPRRLVLSRKMVTAGMIEVGKRADKSAETIPMEELLNQLNLRNDANE